MTQQPWNPWTIKFSNFIFNEEKIIKIDNDLNNPSQAMSTREDHLWWQRLKRYINFWLQTGGITEEESAGLQSAIEICNRWQVTPRQIAESIIPLRQKWGELKEKMMKGVSPK